MKLYAAIYEWRGGSQNAMEFSANSFLDVYQGHVDTFSYIKNKCERKYHFILGEIYSRAR
jgi:hypothetical protein